MSSEKFIFIASVCVVAIFVSRSTAGPAPKVVNIEDVLNRTVCPFKVDIDINEDRVPRRIKMIRCAEQPNHWCRANAIPDHECCHHKHSNHEMECVEVRDKALVYYKSSDRTDYMDVTVGCTCMIGTVNTVHAGS
ncbi:uncharacterized protein LOC134652233 [Cydia amplana]|uniref:uncharacterized protein LOC134652233 n=1 Tax=Cydia amplana TaxID=1869771 RepID=UPI002FE63481